MKQKLIEDPIKFKQKLLLVCPIKRYNYFIDVYNLPNNMVGGQQLQKMTDHRMYSSIFEYLNSIILKILLVVILFLVPGINIVILICLWYCVVVYFLELKVFNRNKSKVEDPFKNMVYDPQICSTLKKDHYFFQVELKELDGFTFNYNEEMKKELNLRKERGKVKFMVYSPQFWCYCNKYPNYKKYHIVLAIVSTLTVILSCVFWFFFLF